VTNTMSLSNGVLKLNGLTATNPVRRFFRAVQSP
jgi:hypothetical protein